jgi:ketosteroid isomerase-like protein
MTRRDALTAAAALTLARPQTAAANDAAMLKLLDDFAAAWNRHDVDGLMACMAPGCVFEAAAGPDVTGARHVGPDAVRRAYAAVFATYADARAVSEWTFTGTTKDGTRVEVNGCDIFTLRGGKIALKNSYRKQRSV